MTAWFSVSDSILNKPSSLSDGEWIVIKRHPQVGVEILEPLGYLQEEKKIIYHHHERYDGKGYPDGLKGENIPLGSRIIAVADTFDAMNSERPYRKRLPEEYILSELKKASGNQLDPNITSVFLSLLKQKPSLWARE